MPRTWSKRRRERFENKQAKRRTALESREERIAGLSELDEERALREIEYLAVATNQHVLAIDDSPAGDIIAVGDEPTEVPSPRDMQLELFDDPPLRRPRFVKRALVMETGERGLPWWHR